MTFDRVGTGYMGKVLRRWVEAKLPPIDGDVTIKIPRLCLRLFWSSS